MWCVVVVSVVVVDVVVHSIYPQPEPQKSILARGSSGIHRHGSGHTQPPAHCSSFSCFPWWLRWAWAWPTLLHRNLRPQASSATSRRKGSAPGSGRPTSLETSPSGGSQAGTWSTLRKMQRLERWRGLQPTPLAARTVSWPYYCSLVVGGEGTSGRLSHGPPPPLPWEYHFSINVATGPHYITKSMVKKKKYSGDVLSCNDYISWEATIVTSWGATMMTSLEVSC